MKRQVGKLGGWLLILLSVLFVHLLLVAPATAQTVTVLAPNGADLLAIPPFPAEEWTAGSSHTIRWTTDGDIGADVDILLYKAGSLDQTIQASVPNTGALVWTIPTTLAPGADYTVVVASSSTPAIADPSDNPFSISPPVARVITSPAGGETWLIGETRVITWHTGAIDGPNVNLRLIRGQQDPLPGGESVIALNIPNTGSFTWEIPTSVVADSNYRVKVEGVLSGSPIPGDVAYSDNYFSIVEPGFQVLSPNGVENWVAGTTRTITWGAASAAGGLIRIDLFKGGVLETVISNSTANTGSFAWAIPGGQPLGSNYIVRVTSLADPTLSDESDAQFTISSSASIITYPVGGGAPWVTGTTETITWRLDAVPSATVSLYLVRGQSDPTPGGETIIILGVPNTGSFPWNLPKSIPSDINYRVKLEYAVPVGESFVTMETYSDNYFTITSPSFQVLTPNGGENWLTGTTPAITWMTTAAAGANVSIDLFRGGALYSSIAASTPNTGSYSWPIPAGQALGNDYTIRVTSIADPTLYDDSDAQFTIATSASIITSPVGGEAWLSGTSQTVSWRPSSVDSDTVSLYLVRGQSDPAPGGETIIILNYPNNGSFSWTVPGSIPPDSNYRVKLVGGSVETYSENYFTITKPSFRVLAPNGGETWVAGMTRTVTWSAGAAGATVRLDLYKSGAPYTVIANTTANSGSYTWSIPAGQTPGDDYTIRVTSVATPTLFDDSDGAFSIGSAAGIITSPIGGEVWLGGESQTIIWQQNLIDATTVEIFLVKGQSDPNPGAETPIILTTPNNGSFSWVIPASILSDTDYRIMVVGGGVTAYSDNYFSILQTDFRVVSPNGGENWLAGSTHTVTWLSAPAGGADVRIELFKKGVLNSVIAAATPNDGSFAWTIRNEQNPGADYRVRVTSLSNPQVAGESAEDFAIVIGQPYDILLSNDTAAIYSPIGTAVGAFTTLDPNPGDTFTYSLGFCANCDNASFRIAGGTLQAAEVFMTIGAAKNITVTSTDQSGQEVTRNFKVYIVGPDQTPSDLSLNDNVIESLLPMGTRVGEFSTVDPNAADPNYGETFLYSLVAGAGDTGNGDFRIVGNQLQTDMIFLGAGTRSIRVRSTDRTGLFREEIFDISVSVNQPPALAPIGNKTINEGQNLSFVLAATDANGGQLVFSASGLPSGATLAGANFSWTPTNTQAGVYNVTFEVSDGVAVDTETIQITVSDVNPMLFFEQFADGTTAGDANWNKNAGAWAVPASSAMRYRATSATVTSLSTVKTTFLPRISSGRIEGVVRMLNLAPAQNAMIVFAFQGNARYRYAQLVSGGEVRVGQVGDFGGATAGIKARNAVSAAVATNYALRADTYPDGRVKVYFKGTLVLNYKFPSAVLGTVGVGVVNNGAEFDNFRVTDATVLPARVK